MEDIFEDDGPIKLINVLFYHKFGFLKSKKDALREKEERRIRKLEIKAEINEINRVKLLLFLVFLRMILNIH